MRGMMMRMMCKTLLRMTCMRKWSLKWHLQASPECDSATLPRVEYEGNSWVRFDDDYDHADCCDDDNDEDDGFDVITIRSWISSSREQWLLIIHSVEYPLRCESSKHQSLWPRSKTSESQNPSPESGNLAIIAKTKLNSSKDPLYEPPLPVLPTHPSISPIYTHIPPFPYNLPRLHEEFPCIDSPVAPPKAMWRITVLIL